MIAPTSLLVVTRAGERPWAIAGSKDAVARAPACGTAFRRIFDVFETSRFSLSPSLGGRT
jgi:hypothetical protein